MVKAPMSELKRLAEDASKDAMLTAGKDAAKRAAADLFLSDEERAAKEAEEAAATKKRRTKWLVLGVLGLFVVIGVLGMVMSYWHYFLAAGLLGLAGLYARSRLKQRLAAKRAAEGLRIEAPGSSADADADSEGEQPRRKATATDDDDAATRARDGRAQQARREREARSLAEARAAEEQDVEDELAAMKARLDKKR
jgi:hypothetical protein